MCVYVCGGGGGTEAEGLLEPVAHDVGDAFEDGFGVGDHFFEGQDGNGEEGKEGVEEDDAELHVAEGLEEGVCM